MHPNHSGEYRVEEDIQDFAEAFLTDIPNNQFSFTFLPLVDKPYVVAMDPNHPLANEPTISLSQCANYPTTIYPMMIQKKYMDEIHSAFHNTQNLYETMDVDHQVETVYSLLGTDSLVIGANPFLESLQEIKKVPLDTGWVRTYGLIYKEPVTFIKQQYITAALEFFQKNKE